MTLIAVYTTVGSHDAARAMAQAIVGQRLAACAQITPIESVYTWDGALQHEPEFRILFKTVEAQWDAVSAAIRALHPYELPAIHAVAVAHASAAYAEWVAQGSAGAASP